MEKHIPTQGAQPLWTPAPGGVLPPRHVSGDGGRAAMAFDPMVVGTARFDSDEERRAALDKALERGLAGDVVEDFDFDRLLGELRREWEDAGLL